MTTFMNNHLSLFHVYVIIFRAFEIKIDEF
jgi:hypothetical protein